MVELKLNRLKNLPGYLKIAEIFVGIICFGLTVGAFNYVGGVGFGISVMSGPMLFLHETIVICLVETMISLALTILFEPPNEIIFNTIAVLFNFAAGIAALADPARLGMVMPYVLYVVAGVFTLVNAILYGGSFYFTGKDMKLF